MSERVFIVTPFFLDEYEEGLEALARPGWRVNRPTSPEREAAAGKTPASEKQERMVALYRPLRDAVAEAVGEGKRPVSVAGDCCTSLAVLAGLQRAGLAPSLIWFDAHGDFNTWETTPSGFLGGMPLAMAVGRGEQTMVEGVGLTPLPEERVILTDARDLDPGEREAVAGSGVTHLGNVEALLEMELPAGPLYVHFDTDVLDPEEAPAMNYPAPGGPTAEVLRRVFRRLSDSGRVAAVSLSSWAVGLDEDGRSEGVCLGLLEELA